MPAVIVIAPVVSSKPVSNGNSGNWPMWLMPVTYIRQKSTYLFPGRVLSRLFRGKMVSRLRQAANEQQLSRLTSLREVDHILRQLMAKKWMVYAKPCLHKAETVVKYLSRYTRKIAISESRLLAMDETHVHFRYQDYRDDQSKVMTLEGPEFLRRFLQHVLPQGFMRIRHFGWLANACRKQQLPLVRQAIATLADTPAVIDKATDTASVSGFEGIPCSCCKTGVMRVRYPLRPVQQDYG